MVLLFLIILGLVVGSFLAAYTWRIENNISIAKGRSFCDECKTPIYWYDNIPVLSYLLLQGKCRKCGKKISKRYPLIEGSTALFFTLVGLFYNQILASLPWLTPFGFAGIIFLLFLAAVSVAIVVTDVEEMIIPDEFVFAGVAVSLLVLLLSPAQDIWMRLFTSFALSSFFLLLNLFTKGKGMGLGDVKLALLIGMLLTPIQLMVWFLTSFGSGAIIGIILMMLSKATGKSKIAFGPFMILGFWLTIFLGTFVIKFYFPFLS